MKDLRKREERNTVSEANTGLIGVDIIENALVSDLTL